MTQTVFFLHSAGPQDNHEGSSDFIAWLQTALGPQYEVLHPPMPDPDNPDYTPWKKALSKTLSKLEGDVILIGHSLGGSVLIKYLTEEKIGAHIKGLFLCAAPFWGADEDWQYEPFILANNYANALPPIPQVFIYRSKDDPIVPQEHVDHYIETIPQAIARSVDGDSHAFEEGLPQLVNDIKSLSL